MSVQSALNSFRFCSIPVAENLSVFAEVTWGDVVSFNFSGKGCVQLVKKDNDNVDNVFRG
jgi:hypothetical protein